MVPIAQDTLTRLFSYITQPIIKTIPFAAGVVIPITENGKCPFLQSDYGCAIYNDRPAICKKYGDETHPFMTCSYQTKDGEARPEKERKKIAEVHTKATNKTLGRK